MVWRLYIWEENSVMQNDEILKKVDMLVDNKNLSTYFISKKTGVANSIIVRLRSGERQTRNLSLKVAIKLADLWDELVRNVELTGTNKVSKEVMHQH